MAWYDPRTWLASDLTPLPLQHNPGSADLLARHVGRLANLYSAQKRGDTPQIRSEIRERMKAVAAYGHSAPIDEGEARALLLKVKG